MIILQKFLGKIERNRERAIATQTASFSKKSVFKEVVSSQYRRLIASVLEPA